jgi:aminoglycoside phosphotransferase
MRPSAYQLAKAFAEELNKTLTAEQMEEVNRLNAAEENDGICHSHDFCDANVIMLNAWQLIDPTADCTQIIRSPKLAAKWNIAWDMAKTNGFSAAAITEQEQAEAGE